MYENYFGLTAKPFQLNPDPSFYFESSQHRRAMAYVEYGLHQSEGFVVVTGEVGAGKTTLVRNLLSRLDANKIVATNLVSTQLDADDILRIVAASFGIRTRDVPKSDLLLSLEASLADHTRHGKRCILIVDEAQNLTPRAVEELRMLSNFQLGSHAMLQSFLIGQPEFRLILQSPQFNQLRQRVIAACHIGPLDADETRRYVEHRLKRAGWKGRPSIAADVYDAVHAATAGIPRRVNLLFDRMLLSAFISERNALTADDARAVAAEIYGETNSLAATGSTANVQLHDGPLMSEPARAPALPLPPAPREPVPAEPAPVVNQEMRELREALSRVERENQITLGLMRKLMQWFRSREAGGSGRG